MWSRVLPLLLAVVLHTSPTWRGGVCPAWLANLVVFADGLCQTECEPCCGEGGGCGDPIPQPCQSPGEDGECPCWVECSTPLPAIKTDTSQLPEFGRSDQLEAERTPDLELRSAWSARPPPIDSRSRIAALDRPLLCVWIE